MKIHFEYARENKDPENSAKIGKVTAKDSKWAQRKKIEHSSDRSFHDNIWGADVYETWKSVHKKNNYSHYNKETKEKLKGYDERRRKRLPAEIEELVDQLTEIANADPKLVFNLFYSYSTQAPDLDHVIKHLGLNWKNLGDKKEKLLEAIFGQTHDYARDVALKCYKQLAAGENPDWTKKKIFMDILRFHGEDEKAKELKLEAIVPKFTKRFKEGLLPLIESGVVPVKKQIVFQRLKHLSVRAVDALLAHLDEKNGDYNSIKHTVRIASHLSPEKAWQVFVHEMMHAVSGQMEKVEQRGIPEEYGTVDDDLLSDYQMMKSGIRLLDGKLYPMEKPPIKTRPELMWLNEAVTQTLSMLVGKFSESGVYKRERELLDLFIAESGISKEDIYKAYFENFEGEKKGKHPMPALQKLFVECNKRFGTGFLVNLDLFIRVQNDKADSKKAGVVKATEKWKELGKDFPQFLKEETAKYRADNKK